MEAGQVPVLRVEVHWFEAGHIGAGVEQDIQHQFLMLRFAYRVLG